MFLPFLPAAPTEVASTPIKTADDQGSLRTGPEGARNTVRKVLRSGETAFKYERRAECPAVRSSDDGR
jgi:hypothetical protein